VEAYRKSGEARRPNHPQHLPAPFIACVWRLGSGLWGERAMTVQQPQHARGRARPHECAIHSVTIHSLTRWVHKRGVTTHKYTVVSQPCMHLWRPIPSASLPPAGSASALPTVLHATPCLHNYSHQYHAAWATGPSGAGGVSGPSNSGTTHGSCASVGKSRNEKALSAPPATGQPPPPSMSQRLRAERHRASRHPSCLLHGTPSSHHSSHHGTQMGLPHTRVYLFLSISMALTPIRSVRRHASK